MTFDESLKNIIRWNIKAFEHMLIMLRNTPGADAELLRNVLKAGYQQNFYLYQSISQLQFIPGDEEAAAFEQEQQPQMPVPAKPSEDVKKDLDELERMFKLEAAPQLPAVEPIPPSPPVVLKPEGWYQELFKRVKKEDNGTKDTGTDKS